MRFTIDSKAYCTGSKLLDFRAEKYKCCSSAVVFIDVPKCRVCSFCKKWLTDWKLRKNMFLLGEYENKYFLYLILNVLKK